MSTQGSLTVPTGDGLPARLAGQILEWARIQGLPPGAHLREQALAEMFKVSRTPVRLALDLLREADRVEQRPNRGYFLREAGLATTAGAVPRADDPVYLRIAEDRLAGALAERVTEAELLRRYGIAPARLRRILARMAEEGWIDRLPGQGWAFQPILTST
ncbi:GntR family transcriptional regulator, partial [Xanthomonas sontii]|uniref:GntR family transcriptional regulator n=1 Tax=Xanthomonas sontii TaxID=2650745 RepID=UPI0027EFD32E